MSPQDDRQYRDAPRGRGASYWLAWLFGSLLVLLGGFFVFLVLGVALLVGKAPETLGELDGVAREYVLGERDSREVVAMIPVHGTIGQAGGFLGGEGVVLEDFRRYLRAAEAPEVVGVVLHVDSPGGTVTDSDAIHALLQDFRRRTGKKVVAYLHSVAASGGYYVAMATDRVVAQPTVLTGSIGVILGAWNWTEAMDKVGVHRVTILSPKTPFKDILSPDRPMRDDERAWLTGMVEEMYEGFVRVVDEGRPALDLEQVRALADGRVYTGRQAREAGLVDELGGLADAFRWVEAQSGRQGLALVRFGEPRSVVDALLGRAAAAGGASGGSTAELAANLGRLVGALDPTPRLLYLWTGVR
ncbi:MAG: signal peptide peptidase SppA [Planctomycetota bacterium]